ncbi:hypothetical protein CVT91_08135 [Candidatus Atribacteria bacterium HGW-Atribacteria-1]|nr:MAG: hypothetical protein CVT91_08135 [Candidatus Atribacteria bacterium HGW-Atribacteria-1]
MVKKILKKEKPDIVHINATIPYLSLSVYSAVRSLNLPMVSTIHSIVYLFPFTNLPYLDKIAGIKYPFLKDNYKIYEKISNVYRGINRIIIGSPDLVTFPTTAIINEYEKYKFFKHSTKIVFPNFIEINGKNLKNEKTSNKETFDIMYCGGFQRHKGWQTLIKAFKKIKNPDIRLHIFGGGEKDVEEYFKMLTAGDKRIIFYGRLPNNELQKFYEIADVTVVPSECFENFSIAIIESFRAGVPVIGSNAGGNPELIKEDYNGFLFEPGNVEQLKNILEKAINNKEKLKEMGENAFEWVKKLDTKKITPKLEEIYKEAIKLKQRK